MANHCCLFNLLIKQKKSYANVFVESIFYKGGPEKAGFRITFRHFHRLSLFHLITLCLRNQYLNN